MTDVISDKRTLESRLAALTDELEDIDDRRAAILGQIEKAKADRITTGERADPDWWRRAKGAHRHLGVERNAVATEIAEVKAEIRRVNRDVNRALFRQAVLDVVDESTWQRIVARHDELAATGAGVTR